MTEDTDQATLLDRALEAVPEATREIVAAAYALAQKSHAGQTRDEGTPYILHPLRVAAFLAEQGHRDPELLAAALLHDTLEDTSLTEAEIEAAFGGRVAELVRALTKPDLRSQSRIERDRLYYAQLASAPREALIIKLADRLDNVRYLHLSPVRGKAAAYLKETEERYLPLAHRVGGPEAEALLTWWAERGQL
ncbi:MAG: hypothetical protein HW403_68 [Dehalococcoidia bacterium]|nr:hypothetical protein [Dehalococcoidia bacterium]